MPDWLAAKKKGERRRRNKGEEGQGMRLIQVCMLSLSAGPGENTALDTENTVAPITFFSTFTHVWPIYPTAIILNTGL